MTGAGQDRYALAHRMAPRGRLSLATATPVTPIFPRGRRSMRRGPTMILGNDAKWSTIRIARNGWR